jgi:hypothetical protein
MAALVGLKVAVSEDGKFDRRIAGKISLNGSTLQIQKFTGPKPIVDLAEVTSIAHKGSHLILQAEAHFYLVDFLKPPFDSQTNRMKLKFAEALGVPLPTPPTPSQILLEPRTIGVAAIVVAFVTGALVLQASGPVEREADAATAQVRPEAGSAVEAADLTSMFEKTLFVKGLVVVPVATSEAAQDEYGAAAARGDSYGIARLYSSGRVLKVENGAAIRLLDGGLFSSQVRIEEGEHRGEAGWIPNEWMKDGRCRLRGGECVPR